MTLSLILAIAFTIGAIATFRFRSGNPWWLLPLALTAGAVINWLRYLEVIGS